MDDKLDLADNHASGSGGGMSIVTPILLRVGGATFTSNVAEFGNGGGVSMIAADDQTRKFARCRFEGNRAVTGGGMYLYTSAGNETIADSTFTNNYAGMEFPSENMGNSR